MAWALRPWSASSANQDVWRCGRGRERLLHCWGQAGQLLLLLRLGEVLTQRSRAGDRRRRPSARHKPRDGLARAAWS